MNSAVLLTESLPGWHTAEKMNEAIEQWGLEDQVIACVHDNTASSVAANSPTRVNWISVTCFAHTLQLAINDGLALYLYQVYRWQVNLLATSVTATQQPCTAKGTGAKGPRNSPAYPVVVEQRWAVAGVLSDRTVTKLQDARVLELKDEYWQMMEDTQPALSALEVEFQVCDCMQQFAGNTENYIELPEIDLGLAWQLSPHDSPSPDSRGGFNM